VVQNWVRPIKNGVKTNNLKWKYNIFFLEGGEIVPASDDYLNELHEAVLAKVTCDDDGVCTPVKEKGERFGNTNSLRNDGNSMVFGAGVMLG